MESWFVKEILSIPCEGICLMKSYKQEFPFRDMIRSSIRYKNFKLPYGAHLLISQVVHLKIKYNVS